MNKYYNTLLMCMASIDITIISHVNKFGKKKNEISCSCLFISFLQVLVYLALRRIKWY